MSAAPVYINANEFMQTLAERGLVIVSIKEFSELKALKRKRIMRKVSVTLKEIVDFDLLPMKSKKGVNDWILNGKIHKDEVVPGTPIKVLTSAIRRLGYTD